MESRDWPADAYDGVAAVGRQSSITDDAAQLHASRTATRLMQCKSKQQARCGAQIVLFNRQGEKQPGQIDRHWAVGY